MGMVRPEGVEPPTYWFVASCSIQLSYGRTLQGCNLFRIAEIAGWGKRGGCWRVWFAGAPGRTRTSDPLVRSQMLYPAELRARVPPCRVADRGGKDKCWVVYLH